MQQIESFGCNDFRIRRIRLRDGLSPEVHGESKLPTLMHHFFQTALSGNLATIQAN